MPLTPSEEKMLGLLKTKGEPTQEERAWIDVLEEKSREAGISIGPDVQARVQHARAFADSVANGAITEYVLLGVDRAGQPVIAVSYALHAAASYVMTAILRQLSTAYENRLQKILEAKMSS